MLSFYREQKMEAMVMEPKKAMPEKAKNCDVEPGNGPCINNIKDKAAMCQNCPFAKSRRR